MEDLFTAHTASSLEIETEQPVEGEEGVVSRETLKRLGRNQRQPLGTSTGYCRAISRGLVEAIEEQEVAATTYETTVDDGHATHMCVLVASEDIVDIEIDEGTTIVDTTIDQFNVGFCEAGGVEASVGESLFDLPAVGIYPPNAPEREEWYNTDSDRRHTG